MHTTLPLALVLLIALAILGIGSFYMAAPQRILGSFGLPLPAQDTHTLAWLHLKGIRDAACGITVLVLLLTTNTRTVGIVTLTLALIPFGDMTTILLAGGRTAAAFFVHGLTCLVMVAAGLLLLHVR